MSIKFKKSALMVASVPSMIEFFNLNNIKLLQEQGYTVSVACHLDNASAMSEKKIKQFKDKLSSMGVEVYNVEIPRSILSVRALLNSIKTLRHLMNRQGYQLLHVHSPVGGVVARIAAKLSRHNMRVIYTAHGFHFFKGAPIWQWVLFFSIEWLCGWLTDDLITINQEDYLRATKYFKRPRVHYINGVGINVNQFCKEKASRLSDKLRLISVGELNSNKNHSVVIEAIAKCNHRQAIEYTICGKGPLQSHLEKLIQVYKLEAQVSLLGFRDDIPELLANNDVFIFPSLREGLPVSLMEAMATGLPIIASRIRGNTDLLDNELGGFLFEKTDSEQLANILSKMVSCSQEQVNEMSEYNLKKIQNFDSKIVDCQMDKIYQTNE